MAFNDGRVVSNFVAKGLRGEALSIYGEGRQTRSFCYVDDLVEGFMRVSRLDKLEGPMNLGNPKEFTIAELAQLVKELTGSGAEFEYHPMPADDPKQRRPDIGRAQELLGYEPRVELREGLKHTIEDFRRRLTPSA
jgi:UDP-glucuronate decarboxylase